MKNSTAPLPPECVAGTTTIQDIQGSSFLSPLRGTDVERVAGVVTAVRSTGSSRGFWIQQANPDAARPAASSGIFVFSTAAVSVGDAVLVTGRVTDFYPLAQGTTTATTDSLSITEITPTVVTTVSKGNPLPAALVITPTTVPAVYAPVVAGGNIETITPVDPARSVLEFWEAHEGMLVTVNDVRVVGPGQPVFGEISVTTKPDELRTPRGGTYIKSYVETLTGRLVVVPVDGQVPAANVGDVLTGSTTGPLDWSRFGGYALAATALGTRQDNGLTATVADLQDADQLAIGTYNVENLAPGDAAAKYTRLGQGVVNNLRSPDVIAVEEIQDNKGAVSGVELDGVVDADQTLNKLTAAISAAGGPAYQWVQINPVDHQDGGQPGGNIRTVFLYNPARVTFTPTQAAPPVDLSITAVSVTTATDGTASLSLNPGRVDPTNPAWVSSRKPLAGEFIVQGRKVIVVANHFNSKGGDQSADGRFQPPNRSSEEQRTQQAIVLHGFVKDILAADPDANIVLAGDFNDYQFSAPILRLTDNGATLTDLITTLPENERYTYVFNGVSQVLDHIFLTKPITDVEYQVVHLNAEFAGQVSDHDPQVVRIRPSVRQGTLTLDPSSVVVGNPVTVRLAGWYPNRTFTIALDGTTAGSVTTDANGAATFSLPVPVGTAVGTHTVTATSADRATASASLLVEPVPVTLGSVRISPTRLKAGNEATFRLAGWSAGATLVVTLEDGTRVGTITTDASGSARTKLTIPVGTSKGAHVIVVTASDGGTVRAPVEVR